jgi:hypothetical protein
MSDIEAKIKEVNQQSRLLRKQIAELKTKAKLHNAETRLKKLQSSYNDTTIHSNNDTTTIDIPTIDIPTIVDTFFTKSDDTKDVLQLSDIWTTIKLSNLYNSLSSTDKRKYNKTTISNYVLNLYGTTHTPNSHQAKVVHCIRRNLI